MLTLLAVAAFSPALVALSPRQLWEDWTESRFVQTEAPCLRPTELTESMESLAARHGQALKLEEVGRSFLGRPIHMLTLGRGEERILFWSQMHGDEPSATPALLDIVDYLLARSEEPAIGAVLDNFTLLVVPMLNPDGAETYHRRNAQGIDINRDALNLATPEGRLLKRLRDQYEPILGFNLHDQNRRTTVGDTGELATNAVLAVSGDPEGTVTPGRLRAKRACAAIVEALAPFMPGRMARYDEDWSPRAFGDNLTAWGTPVVLIESGGFLPGDSFSLLTRLNFVAILAVLQDLARNDLADYDPEVYENLRRNQSNSWTDVAIRGGHMLQPGTSTPYRADLSFDVLNGDRLAAGCGTSGQGWSHIVELGDNRFLSAGREEDATGRLIVAPFEVGADGWSARRWLNAGVLADLAEMGIGTVHWRVKKKHVDNAESIARRLFARGRPRIRVTSLQPDGLMVRLDGPPRRSAAGATLAQILGSFEGAGRNPELGYKEGIEALQLLWNSSSGVSAARAALRPGAEASFLLLAPVDQNSLDLARTSVAAVWLDGVEVHAEP